MFRRGKLWIYLSTYDLISKQYDKNLYYKFLKICNKENEHNIEKDINRTKFYSLIEVFKRVKLESSGYFNTGVIRGVDMSYNLYKNEENIDESIKAGNVTDVQSSCGYPTDREDELEVEKEEQVTRLTEEFVGKKLHAKSESTNSEVESKYSKETKETKEFKETNKSSKEINNKDSKQINIRSINLIEKTDLLTEKQKLKIFNVIKAFSSYDEDIGYTQGMNFIVGMLLMFTNSERASFWIFVDLMENKEWRNMFTNGTPKLITILDIFTIKMKKKLPELFNHFEEIYFTECIHGIFSNFFLTIFTYNVYVEFSSRIFDMFFLLGEKVIIDTLIHLLKLQENKLLKMDMEQTVVYIRTTFVNDCIEENGIPVCIPY